MPVSPYWVTLTTGKACCVEAEDKESAMAAAKQHADGEVVSCDTLPYPAEPRITHYERDYDGHKVACPSFCYTPEQCKGRTCCPKKYACSE